MKNDKSTNQNRPLNEMTEDELNDAINRAVTAKLELLNKNEFYLSGTIVKKFTLSGGDRMDKEGNVIGKWDDACYVDVAFSGDTNSIQVDTMAYALLEEGKAYQFNGRLVAGKFAQFKLKILGYDAI